MVNDPTPPSDRSNDLREDPRFADVFSRYLEELKQNGFIDTDEIVAAHPDLGPAIVEDLETYIQLRPVEEYEEDRPLGTLGDYTLRRQIGRGGMGVVYEAWENSMDRVVALKVLPAGVAVDDKAFNRFMREARAAGRLNHQNVVPVHAMGQVERTPYYAMEYVEGETLARILARLRAAEVKEEEKRTVLQSLSQLFGGSGQKIVTAESEGEEAAMAELPSREKPFGVDDDNQAYYFLLASAFAGVAEGLQHAHARGVIHRDIKPSNLILDTGGRLRILDFGLAHLAGEESLTASGDFVGTPLYMSPEQARARTIPIDHRTDVYSLGATMYEMLTWRPPFKGKDQQDTLSQIIGRDPVLPRRHNPRIPRDFETIVLKCLRKDPADRYGTAEALGQDLRRFARGDPIEARPQAAWERLLRRAKRHRGKIFLAAAALIVSLVVGVLTYEVAGERKKAAVAEYERTVVGAATKLLTGRTVLSAPARYSPPLFLPKEYQTLLGESGKRAATEAIEGLTRAAGLLPERFEAHYYLAQAFQLLERRDEAIAELEETLRRNPDFVPATVLMAELLPTKEESPEMHETGAPPLQPPWSTWRDARRALREGRWEAAATAYGELIALQRKTRNELYLGAALENLLGRGMARLELEEFDRAGEDFMTALNRSQLLWGQFLLEPALLLGKAYYLEGKEALAEEKFTEVLVGAANSETGTIWVAAAYASILDFYRRRELFEEAVKAGRKAENLNPENTATHLDLGWALYRLLWARGEWSSAGVGEPQSPEFRELVEVAEKAYKLDGQNCYALTLLSTVLSAQGEFERAHELSERANEIVRNRIHQKIIERRSEINSWQGRASGAAGALLAVSLSAGAQAPTGTFADCRELTELNTPAWEYGASITAGGRTLVFVRGTWHEDLYLACREAPEDAEGRPLPFKHIRRLDELNTSSREGLGCISPDGLRLYFDSDKNGTFDIYCAERDSDDPDARFRLYPNSSQLFATINTSGGEWAPSLTEDGLVLIFARSGNQTRGSDLWEARRDTINEAFGAPRPLIEVNTAGDEHNGSISSDGLTLFMGAGFEPHHDYHLWMTHRASRDDPPRSGNPMPFRSPDWEVPGCPNVNFPALLYPIISPQWPAAGSRLIFSRTIVTGPDTYDFDLWEAIWHPDEPPFKRGDANSDAKLDIADAIFILSYFFASGAAPACLDAADANDDGAVEMADAITVFGHLFANTGPLPDPFGQCDGDATADALDCTSFPPCEGQERPWG